MKNNYMKVLSGPVAMLTLVALLASPVLAGAEGLKLGLNSDVKVNVETKVDVQDKKDNKKEDKSDSKKNNKNLESNVSASTSVILDDDRLPPGIRNAKGIEKRIENGKGLPAGIIKYLQNWFDRFDRKDKTATSSATTTVKVNLPKIEDVRVVNGTSTVTIEWNTNENTTSEVRYATTSVFTASTTKISNVTSTKSHSAVLSNLAPDTKYYFVIIVKDSDGNIVESKVKSFTTKALDSVAPKIIFNTVFDIKGTLAQIFWVTDEVSNSNVWVSTSTPVSTTATSTVSVSDLVRFHNVSVSGLATSTLYYYTVTSDDKSGNTSSTSSGSFTTLAN